MKMILKQQLEKNRKKGFTLIEVIVVLVILAIMAAIAIPALTGYINEANQRTVISEGRTVLVGLQALASASYGDGEKPFAPSSATADTSYFTKATNASEPLVGIKLTTDGLKKFNELTGLKFVASGNSSVDAISAEGTSITGFKFTADSGKVLTYSSTATKKWVVA